MFPFCKVVCKEFLELSFDGIRDVEDNYGYRLQNGIPLSYQEIIMLVLPDLFNFIKRAIPLPLISTGHSKRLKSCGWTCAGARHWRTGPMSRYL